MNPQNPLIFLFKAITIGLAAAFVVVFLRPDLLRDDRPVVEVRKVDGAEEPGASLGSGPVSYAEAVQRAAPAVVNIYTAKVVTQRDSSLFNDPLFQYFFGDRAPAKTRKRLQTSLGSGVLVSHQGYILTNNHVIAGADEIQVSLPDGRHLESAVVGADPETDLAVLRVAPKDLPSIVIGTSAPPQVGDIALAIGNPFGVGQTVTMGIVSATGRDQLGINTFEDFIQTDAAINPGNSGGALINGRGELIGINTAIYSKSGGSQGIGFAIPAKLATEVMQQIVEHGHTVRGWLGIEAQTLTAKLAQSFGLKEDAGVIVAGVFRNSPAAKAGIEPGDIITRIDNQAAHDSRAVLNLIASHPPGTRIHIQGMRDRQSLDLYATVVQRPFEK